MRSGGPVLGSVVQPPDPPPLLLSPARGLAHAQLSWWCMSSLVLRAGPSPGLGDHQRRHPCILEQECHSSGHPQRQSGDCPALSDTELSLQRSIGSRVLFPGLRGRLRLEWETPARRTAYSIKTPPGGKLACLSELCRAPGRRPGPQLPPRLGDRLQGSPDLA